MQPPEDTALEIRHNDHVTHPQRLSVKYDTSSQSLSMQNMHRTSAIGCSQRESAQFEFTGKGVSDPLCVGP